MKSNSESEIKFTKEVKRRRVHLWCQHCICSKKAEDIRDCGGDLVLLTGNPCEYYKHRMGDKTPPESVVCGLCSECDCEDRGAPQADKCLSKECPLERLEGWRRSFRSKQNV